MRRAAGSQPMRRNESPVATHPAHTTQRLASVEAAVDEVIARVGKRIVLAVPLGLGKPNALVNAIYDRAKQDPSISLEILTALSLERPQPQPGLEARFMGPFVERVFGDYVDLEYMKDIRAGTVPKNISVCEFFFKSGALLGNHYAQQHYISTNYTYAPRDILLRGANVLAQMIAKREVAGDGGREVRYSLSCNPEITLDMYPHLIDRKLKGDNIAVIGIVHDDLPYMVNDAEVSPDFFDIVVDEPQYSTRLFGAPNTSIATPDHMIGLHTSALLRDGGTLQIGIGSLGDAIVYASILRDRHNDVYREALHDTGGLQQNATIIDQVGGLLPFTDGLYGSSEMFVSGFWELMKAGILKRRVYEHLVLQTLLSERRITEQVDRGMIELLVENGVSAKVTDSVLADLQRLGVLRDDVSVEGNELRLPDGNRVPADLGDEVTLGALVNSGIGDTLKGGLVMHGGFLLGPTSLYEGMRHMSEEQRASINMTHISYTNALYGQQELKQQQRRDSRFINTVFTATLLGAAASDCLPNGQVVSGVGGQYNFVAMAHELPGARSILLLRAVRDKHGEASSSIVFSYGHITIPRHLRDIFITEYGIADLRAKTDAEVIVAMLKIADSRFQQRLLDEAKAAGKVSHDYEIPEAYRSNTPERLEQALAKFRRDGHFPAFPFGHDFTDEELVLGKALKKLKAISSDKLEVVRKLLVSTTHPHVPEQLLPYLKRMDLENPSHMKDKLERLLLVDALCEVLGIER